MKKLSTNPLIHWIITNRFIKFAIVGSSGLFINLAILYLCQEYFFSGISSVKMRLNFSLCIAVFFSTASNFIWNRLWTWRDHRKHWNKYIFYQFGQYVFACWIGVGLQIVFTKFFAIYMQYLIANTIAIVLSSFFNYLVNNQWTFRKQTDLF